MTTSSTSCCARNGSSCRSRRCGARRCGWARRAHGPSCAVPTSSSSCPPPTLAGPCTTSPSRWPTGSSTAGNPGRGADRTTAWGWPTTCSRSGTAGSKDARTPRSSSPAASELAGTSAGLGHCSWPDGPPRRGPRSGDASALAPGVLDRPQGAPGPDAAFAGIAPAGHRRAGGGRPEALGIRAKPRDATSGPPGPTMPPIMPEIHIEWLIHAR